MTVTIARIVHRSENYRGFTISWDEPDDARWTANITSEAVHLAAFLRRGVEIIEGADRGKMIANAKRYIDSLFR